MSINALDIARVKRVISESGQTLRDYAAEKVVPYNIAVLLMNGHLKGNYGKAHEQAVALGLKRGNPKASSNKNRRNA